MEKVQSMACEKKRDNGGTYFLKLCHVELESISMVKQGPLEA